MGARRNYPPVDRNNTKFGEFLVYQVKNIVPLTPCFVMYEMFLLLAMRMLNRSSRIFSTQMRNVRIKL